MGPVGRCSLAVEPAAATAPPLRGSHAPRARKPGWSATQVKPPEPSAATAIESAQPRHHRGKPRQTWQSRQTAPPARRGADAQAVYAEIVLICWGIGEQYVASHARITETAAYPARASSVRQARRVHATPRATASTARGRAADLRRTRCRRLDRPRCRSRRYRRQGIAAAVGRVAGRRWLGKPAEVKAAGAADVPDVQTSGAKAPPKAKPIPSPEARSWKRNQACRSVSPPVAAGQRSCRWRGAVLAVAPRAPPPELPDVTPGPNVAAPRGEDAGAARV